MRRREIILVFGAVSALPVWARQPAIPVVGYLGLESPQIYASRLAAFRQGLAEAGFREDRNVVIAFRWAEGRYDRLSALAAELVQQQVSVLAAPGGAPVALAAQSATTTIPIVFEMGGDPVALGVVDSLSRPGGNLTGVSSLSVEVSRKRLEFLHEILPDAGIVAVVANPTSPTANSQLRNLQAAADTIGVQLQIFQASTEEELRAVFTDLPRAQVGGLVFTSDPYFANRSSTLADLALRHRIPAITQSRDFPLAGGLISYGGDFAQSHRNAGIYVGRILKGEKAADLPVQLVTKVELFINLKAAADLRISVPPALMISADQVIE
ncbi:putative ABC transport system substrate-binding protein [Methylobacterium sp. BE186]|uniref:ABC transporter substrate-binding protein n=1 Tax=Methylobacterium sp. BE186 TaxID=2817715 RepID=UPI0028621929|nr:ABC transporter substrate-binding protein [Methylobacterium sp. BE186]MDR7036709.1 putative ABC transport system substrate-binding protein [Methylobacterium sp. BE186]